MWIFLSDAFLSVVADKDDPSGPRLLVRARREGDIERVFPEADVAITRTADYRCRAWLPRQRVIAVMQQQLQDLSYANFKNSIPDGEYAYHDAALEVWSVMLKLQRQPPS